MSTLKQQTASLELMPAVLGLPPPIKLSTMYYLLALLSIIFRQRQRSSGRLGEIWVQQVRQLAEAALAELSRGLTCFEPAGLAEQPVLPF